MALMMRNLPLGANKRQMNNSDKNLHVYGNIGAFSGIVLCTKV